MISIETLSCNNSLEARREERRHIDELHSSLNHSLPSRTIAEWNIANKDRSKEKADILRERNKEAIAATKHSYYERNKETILGKIRKTKNK